MLNVISTIPPFLEKFLGEFKDLFIKPQFKNFKIYPFGLQLELKRTNIQTISECRPKSNYDSLHHFLTNSPWDEEKINNRRIEIIQRDNRTRSRPDGALVIDDVACKKSKSATKIEAAKAQYAGSEKGFVNCNVAVIFYYIDGGYSPGDTLDWTISKGYQIVTTKRYNWIMFQRPKIGAIDYGGDVLPKFKEQ